MTYTDSPYSNGNLATSAICRGRFAPSPTGRMHAGNIYTYLVSWLIAKAQNGKIVLRIEDLDIERSKPEFSDLLMKDFEYLGLFWDEGPYFQSTKESQEVYEYVFRTLEKEGRLYPCFCTRADLKQQSAPHLGEKNIYRGKCKQLSEDEIASRIVSERHSIRIAVPDSIISFEDGIQGKYQQNLLHDCGDFVIKRSDGLFAYQLAVSVDDVNQRITHIVRAYDLIDSTPQQIYLHNLLGSSEINFYHVPLFVNENGRRLSKRDKDASLDEMIHLYRHPEAILGHIAYTGLLIEKDEPLSAQELLQEFDLGRYRQSIQENIGSFQPIVYS